MMMTTIVIMLIMMMIMLRTDNNVTYDCAVNNTNVHTFGIIQVNSNTYLRRSDAVGSLLCFRRSSAGSLWPLRTPTRLPNHLLHHILLPRRGGLGPICLPANRKQIHMLPANWEFRRNGKQLPATGNGRHGGKTVVPSSACIKGGAYVLRIIF